MTLDDRSILSRLGSGEQVDYVKKAAGLNDKKFEEWWDDQLKSRVPDMQGSRKIDGQGKVEILRDELGTPLRIFSSAMALQWAKTAYGNLTI